MSFLKFLSGLIAVSFVATVLSGSGVDQFLPTGVQAYAQQMDDSEQMALAKGMNCLEHYMFAGVNDDFERGAQMLISFMSDEDQAKLETKVFYRRQARLLSEYVSLSSDLYGYELKKTPFGVRLFMEGGVETVNGLTAEYSARMVFKHDRWRIAKLVID